MPYFPNGGYGGPQGPRLQGMGLTIWLETKYCTVFRDVLSQVFIIILILARMNRPIVFICRMKNGES